MDTPQKPADVAAAAFARVQDGAELLRQMKRDGVLETDPRYVAVLRTLEDDQRAVRQAAAAEQAAHRS